MLQFVLVFAGTAICGWLAIAFMMGANRKPYPKVPINER